MHQTNYVAILHASEVLPVVKALVAANSALAGLEVPSFQEMLESQPPVFQFEKIFTEAQHEPIVILHSSGSTGMYHLNMSVHIIDLSRHTQAYRHDPQDFRSPRQ